MKISSPDPQADFDLYVFAPNGSEIGRAENAGSDEEVTKSVKVSGVYTIAVNAFFAQESTYDGVATFTPTPPDGSALKGSPYSWTGSKISGSNQTCSKADATNCDLERIDVALPQGGGSIEVEIISNPGADFDLFVFNADGVSVGQSRTAGVGGTETVTANVPLGGVYTVAVAARSASDSGYSGTFTVNDLPDTHSSYQKALGLGESYSWTGDPPVDANVLFTCAPTVAAFCDNERVWLKVPSAGATLTVQITGDDPSDQWDLSVYVLNPAGTIIGRSAEGGSKHTVTISVTTPGVYTIGVTAVLGPGVTYTGSVSLS